MFKCQNKGCKHKSSHYEAPVRVVLETRQKTYENVIRRGRKSHTVTSQGHEIVKEISVCSGCAEKLKAPAA